MPATREVAGAHAWMHEHAAAASKGWSSNIASTAIVHGDDQGGKYAPA